MTGGRSPVSLQLIAVLVHRVLCEQPEHEVCAPLLGRLKHEGMQRFRQRVRQELPEAAHQPWKGLHHRTLFKLILARE